MPIVPELERLRPGSQVFKAAVSYDHVLLYSSLSNKVRSCLKKTKNILTMQLSNSIAKYSPKWNLKTTQMFLSWEIDKLTTIFIKWNNVQQYKRMNYWYILCNHMGWISNALYGVKIVRLKQLHMKILHLDDILKNAKHLGGWGRRTASSWEVEVTVSQDSATAL